MRPHSSPSSFSSLSTIASTISATDTLVATKPNRVSAPGNLGRKHQSRNDPNHGSQSRPSSGTLSNPSSSRASSLNSPANSEQSVSHKIAGISGRESSMPSSTRNNKPKRSHGCVPLDFGYQNVYASNGAGKKVIAGDSAAACSLM